jgi:hypothetical protein
VDEYRKTSDGNSMSPFPFIPELVDLERITGFNDLTKIMNCVYTLVPWTEIPYEKEIKFENIETLYRQFKKLEIGGWCGLNAEFFKWIIEGYRRLDPFGIRYRSINYGISSKQLTHICVAVEIDRVEFLLDPYFNRYYIHKDGYPLRLDDLLYFVRERKTTKYKSVFLNSTKPAIRLDGYTEEVSPQVLLKEVLDSFELNDFTRIMQNTFGSTNPDLLMLLKIPD